MCRTWKFLLFASPKASTFCTRRKVWKITCLTKNIKCSCCYWHSSTLNPCSKNSFLLSCHRLFLLKGGMWKMDWNGHHIVVLVVSNWKVCSCFKFYKWTFLVSVLHRSVLGIKPWKKHIIKHIMSQTSCLSGQVRLSPAVVVRSSLRRQLKPDPSLELISPAAPQLHITDLAF